MQIYLIYALIGAVMGLLSGLVGIGGGVVAVPALILLAKMSPHHAMGTSLVIIIPVALSGAYRHMIQGNIDLRIGLCIAVTGVVCAYLGAALNNHLDATTLKRILGILMVVIGLKLLFEGKAPETAVPTETVSETHVQ